MKILTCFLFYVISLGISCNVIELECWYFKLRDRSSNVKTLILSKNLRQSWTSRDSQGHAIRHCNLQNVNVHDVYYPSLYGFDAFYRGCRAALIKDSLLFCLSWNIKFELRKVRKFRFQLLGRFRPNQPHPWNPQGQLSSAAASDLDIDANHIFRIC